MKSRLKILGLVLPTVFILDQFTKRLIVLFVPVGSFFPVIPGFFDIVHTRNRGAAFGFMAGLPETVRLPLFFLVSSVALIAIAVYFFKQREAQRGSQVSLALILGGALGNIADRVRLGEVIDFLSFHWQDAHVRWNLGSWGFHFKLEWPAFNVADSAITIAVLWLMTAPLFSKKQEGENPGIR